MKTPAILSLVAILAGAALPASAMTDMGSMGPSPNGGLGGTKATCTAPDQAVIVNTTKMTYELDTAANRSAMKGMMDHDKFVCRSTAEKMGAKIEAAPMPMASPAGKNVAAGSAREQETNADERERGREHAEDRRPGNELREARTDRRARDGTGGSGEHERATFPGSRHGSGERPSRCPPLRRAPRARSRWPRARGSPRSMPAAARG